MMSDGPSLYSIYCRHHRKVTHFSNLVSDTCYVLSFAIIMLNTSLHNHNVRDKPTVERFISMNRGINEGGDLPEELLRVSENGEGKGLLFVF